MSHISQQIPLKAADVFFLSQELLGVVVWRGKASPRVRLAVATPVNSCFSVLMCFPSVLEVERAGTWMERKHRNCPQIMARVAVKGLMSVNRNPSE